MLTFVNKFLVKSRLPPSLNISIRLKRGVIITVNEQGKFNMVYFEVKMPLI